MSIATLENLNYIKYNAYQFFPSGMYSVSDSLNIILAYTVFIFTLMNTCF